MTIFYIFFPFFTLTLQIKFSENSYAIRVRKKKMPSNFALLRYTVAPPSFRAGGNQKTIKIKI
jgi:hypothetical protein